MVNVKFILKSIMKLFLKFTFNHDGTHLTAAVPRLDAAPLPDTRRLRLLLHEVRIRYLRVDVKRLNSDSGAGHGVPQDQDV